MDNLYFGSEMQDPPFFGTAIFSKRVLKHKNTSSFLFDGTA